jgi:hypothetical protein
LILRLWRFGLDADGGKPRIGDDRREAMAVIARAPGGIFALMAADLGVYPHKLEALLTEQLREQLQTSAADERRLDDRTV